jgi:hypothetical protein
MANPNYDTLLSVAIENRSSKVNDTLSNHNALLWVLKDKGMVKPFDGGTKILENVRYSAPGANATSYSGYDVLPTLTGEHLTAAEFRISQYHTSVSISGLEMIQNAGKSRVIDLISDRVEAAESDLMNLICADLYGDGTNAKSLIGLQAMLPAAGTTTGVYGGIDRATNSFWRHKSVDGTVITDANVFDRFLALQTQLVRGTDKPDVILSCVAHYNALVKSMRQDQRFEGTSSAKMANAGFANVMFMGVAVVCEHSTGSTPAEMPDDVSYFINASSVKFRPFKTEALRQIDAPVTAQDAKVKRMLWAGQLVCGNIALNGVVQG